jgi:hypothetical protein
VGGCTVRIRTVCLILYSLYSAYSRMDLAQKLRHFRHDFRGRFQYFLWLFMGHTKQSIQMTMGTENEVQKRSYNNMVLAHKMR